MNRNRFKSQTVSLVGLCVVLFLSLLSCGDSGDEERKEEWIRNEVNRQIKEFKAEKREECMSQILMTAEAEVDSIISQKDLFGNVMNKDIPDKPIKPEYVPLDSNAIKNHKVEKVLD